MKLIREEQCCRMKLGVSYGIFIIEAKYYFLSKGIISDIIKSHCYGTFKIFPLLNLKTNQNTSCPVAVFLALPTGTCKQL